MDKAREQHNVLMDKGSEQLTAFWVSCYSIEKKGIEQGQMKTVINTLKRYIRRQMPISTDILADIAEDNEMTVDKVRTIAKDNGISLSC